MYNLKQIVYKVRIKHKEYTNNEILENNGTNEGRGSIISL